MNGGSNLLHQFGTRALPFDTHIRVSCEQESENGTYRCQIHQIHLFLIPPTEYHIQRNSTFLNMWKTSGEKG
ncbi:hypothetical protein DSECCO2_569110 [anaerobic digester metagenome]